MSVSGGMRHRITALLLLAQLFLGVRSQDAYGMEWSGGGVRYTCEGLESHSETLPAFFDFIEQQRFSVNTRFPEAMNSNFF